MTKPGSYRLPNGFSLGGLWAGIKSTGAPDLAMIVCDQVAVATALTTTNRFPAAPIQLCRQRLAQRPSIRGVIVNSGNANAMTGAEGLRDAREMATLAERAAGCPAGSFLVASTGIIGQHLPMNKISGAVPKLAQSLSNRDCLAFADAIQTTDTRRKVSCRTIPLGKMGEASILGIAKGVGMMEPNMATMLAFILTDFPLAPSKARRLLVEAAEESFHCLTVDGQTSTNDMALLISSSGERHQRLPRGAEETFFAGLLEVCQDLCKQIATDGEGATKLVTVQVEGSNTRAQARRLAKEVANSMLVKTAIFGENPNWGRVLQALGKAGIPFSPERVSVQIQSIPVVTNGSPVDGSRAELRKAMKEKEISINIKVGGGKGRCRVWTCDLTDGYIRINAEYN
jgi:glutamate N-acetyltransferase/amino-acid N-acetyltransferase